MIKIFGNEGANTSADPLNKQLILFGFAGIINTFVGFVVFSGATIFLDTPYWVSNFFSVVAGIICGFTLSRTVVFKSQKTGLYSNMWKYVATIFLQYVVGTSLIGFLVSKGISEIPSYVIVLPVVVSLSFALQKLWVFNKKEEV
ncbi:MAG: GtrA family protein [Hyphomonadaceae bacterium]|nr:GtrA family protein [Hyphomonadaceae bacterium]